MAHRPKKSLGQHFLRSASAINAIVASGKVSAADTVLEERFAEQIASGQLKLIQKDILEFNPALYSLMAGRYKLVANIPYYITGAIFEKFLGEKNPPSCMVVLIQKEVATRIVARDGKESILSISVKAFGTPRITAKVPASAFRPAPKVDSAVLCVENISSEKFSGKSTDYFFSVVKSGFAHKRKLLVRNLESVAHKDAIAKACAELGIGPKARAEDIAPELWFSLARVLYCVA